MHTTLAEIVERVEADRDALMEASRALTQTQLDFRINAESWSIGENLDHLALVEKSVARLLRMKVAEARANGRPADVAAPSQLASLDGFDITNNQRKVKVPDARLSPRHGVTRAELFANLESSRRSLRESFQALADYDLSAHTFTHPILGDINLYQWILLVGLHERRHLKQIDAVLRDSRFPAA